MAFFCNKIKFCKMFIQNISGSLVILPSLFISTSILLIYVIPNVWYQVKVILSWEDQHYGRLWNFKLVDTSFCKWSSLFHYTLVKLSFKTVNGVIKTSDISHPQSTSPSWYVLIFHLTHVFHKVYIKLRWFNIISPCQRFTA